MSGPSVDRVSSDAASVHPLFARAASAPARARQRRAAEVRDLLSDAEARLDERTRAAAELSLDAIVVALERGIRAHAAAHLAEHGEMAASETLGGLEIDMTTRLADGGVLSDAALIEEVLARVGETLLSERMPIDFDGEASGGGLVLRLTLSRDAGVAVAARALVAADAERRSEIEGDASAGDIAEPLRAHLVWPIAAILRGELPRDPATDAALAHAAARLIEASGEKPSLEAVAMRLADALSPDPAERAMLVVEALADRRPALAAALLAHALGTDYETMRELILDAEGERLWLVLRALDFDRPTIARIGFLLCEADPRRSIEAFADMLDTVMTVSRADAAEAIAELRLPHAYRDALDRLRARGRA